jgi:nitroreductase
VKDSESFSSAETKNPRSMAQDSMRTEPVARLGLLRKTWWKAKRFRSLLQIMGDQFSDGLQFFKWSHTGMGDQTLRKKEAAILKAYHGIEKGLSLASPRPGFGKEKIQSLTRKIDEWLLHHEPNDLILSAVESIRNYHAFNLSHNISWGWLADWLLDAERHRKSARVPHDEVSGGVVHTRKSEILEAVAGTRPSFFESRHSIRNFAPGLVPLEDIRSAVRIAQKAPSVCNRQGVKVYSFRPAMTSLAWQPGNSGFGHLASDGLIVTADLQAFSARGERNQAYVDGGLFSMSLVYAFHMLGYGSCMLAWSQSPLRERQLRQALKIPASEVVIMMIAIGNLPESLDVACSQRRPLSDVLVERC